MMSSKQKNQRLCTIYNLLLRAQGSVALAEISDENLEFLRMQDDETYKTLVPPSLARVMIQLMEENDSLTSFPTCFDAQQIPSISIEDYLERIVRYTPCSKECFLLAIIYIDRVIEISGFVVSPYNVHRLIITSIMLAAKLFEDNTYNNKFYAHVGGIGIKELNTLECMFMQLLDHHLFVNPEVFRQYQKDFELFSLLLPEENFPENVVNSIINSGKKQNPKSSSLLRSESRERINNRVRRSKSLSNGVLKNTTEKSKPNLLTLLQNVLRRNKGRLRSSSFVQVCG